MQRNCYIWEELEATGGKALNDKKVTFIVAVYNDEKYTELQDYLGQLVVPEGYTAEMVAGRSNGSTAAVYQQIMKESDAEYKIYIDENTRLLNENFIADIIRTFSEHPEIGILGYSGIGKIIQNAEGKMETEHAGKMITGCSPHRHVWSEFASEYVETVSVDGYVMATQYDVPWRTDLFTGTSGFDIAHSLEFGRRGYKCAIMRQVKPEVWYQRDELKNAFQSEKIISQEYAEDIVYILQETHTEDETVYRNDVIKLNLAWDRFASQIDFDQYELFNFYQGLGETCYYSFLLEEYRKKTGKKIIMLIYSPARQVIMKKCPGVDAVIEVSREVFAFVNQTKMGQYGIHDTLNMHFIKFPQYVSKMGQEIRYALGLPQDTPLKRYSLKNPLHDRMWFEQKYGVDPQKSVLIITDTVCFGSYVATEEFWQKLTDGIRKRGMQAVFNDSESRYDGAKAIYLAVDEMVGFAALCHNVIGARTGLFDVIGAFADSELLLQMLYPTDDNPIWRENIGLRDNLQYSDRWLRFVDYESDMIEELSGYRKGVKTARYVFDEKNPDGQVELLLERMI